MLTEVNLNMRTSAFTEGQNKKWLVSIDHRITVKDLVPYYLFLSVRKKKINYDNFLLKSLIRDLLG